MAKNYKSIVIVHVLHHYNIAFILICAILELWLMQHEMNCEQFFSIL